MVKSGTMIVTDGSHSQGNGGWAVIFADANGKSLQEGSGAVRNTTNNKMELTAVFQAVTHIRKQSQPTEFTLVTDSAYVATGIQNFRKWEAMNFHTSGGTKVANLELWVQLFKEMSDRNIVLTVVKIKGHDGHPLNERADKLARTARLSLP